MTQKQAQNGTEGVRGGRRWRFSSAVLDESAWSLTVNGKPVALEIKPFELLRVLVHRAGEVVSKQELLDAVWGDVAVVEASLPTAIRKLRVALEDDDPDHPMIATVARVGYRLAVPVHAEPAGSMAHTGAAPRSPPPRRWPWLIGASVLLIAIGSVTVQQWGGSDSTAVAAGEAARPILSPTQREARQVLRRMDVPQLEAMVRAGWDPEAPFDTQANGALNILLERCEWDPGHDRAQMVMAARVLIDGGASLTRRNYWGDTAYSIAKAPRYCGGDHPVTVMMRSLCTTGDGVVMAECEADYAGAKRRRAQDVTRRIAS